MGLLDAELPEGFRWIRVGDCYEVTRKPRGLRVASTLPFIPMEAIPQGGHYEPRYATKPGAQITSGTYFERGDLLIAKITPSFENGKQAWTKGLPRPFGYATTEVIPLRPKVPGHDRRLLFFYLLHPEIRSFIAERMEGSTGRQRVPEQVLLELPYPELPIENQRIIADALERITKQIELEARSVQTTEELKRAAMRELFTRGLRGESQKDTEIGPVPESWDVVKFDDVLQIAQGQVDPKEEPYASMFHIGPENVAPGTGELLPCKTARELGLISGKYFFTPEDIVYSKIRPYLNKVVRPDFAGLCSADMYPLRAKAGFSRGFAFHYLLSEFFLSQAVPQQIRTGIPKINREQLAATKFPVPSVEEQAEIVNILDAIDRKIDLHRKKRAVLEELFKALLQKLMIGEIRVADLDLSALEPPHEPQVAA
jgi:type I restriction enzyme S subunit